MFLYLFEGQLLFSADTDPADTDPADTDPADTDPADIIRLILLILLFHSTVYGFNGNIFVKLQPLKLILF